MTALDTELQMPLMEQCDDQVNAKELVKKIKNYLRMKEHPLYGALIPHLVLKGRILGRGHDGSKGNGLYKVQVGALHGFVEGVVMRSDLAQQGEGSERLRDVVPVSIEDASEVEGVVIKFRIQ
jgi:hypothetical protein